jgi:ankyrin repeat protein
VGSTEELFAAIEAGDADAVRTCVAGDPSLATARDAEGVSALMRACYRLDGAICESLLSAGTKLDVFEAGAFGDLDRLTELLDADPSLANAFSADGFSALHLPAFFGKHEAVRLLLQRGADADARGRGWMTGTALHSAAAGKHADAVAELIEAGADPNARQSGGWTPLHSAARNGDVASVEALLDAGADPSATNDEGQTVLELAVEGGDADVIERIRAAVDRHPRGGRLDQAP